jgi:DNA-directed RNA polymerase subunit D
MASIFQNVESAVPGRVNTMTFRLAPTQVAYANTLRRLCMTGVEMVGFNADIKDDGSTSDVKILANSTAMTNEMLAHRVGLLPMFVREPLKWDSQKYKFVLNVENSTDTIKHVFASDFQVLENRGEDWVEIANAQFFPPHPKTGQTCLIASLKPMLPGAKPEEIQIEARATLGNGRQNARWIPTTQCAYAYTRDTDEAHVKQVMDDWLRRAKKIDPENFDKLEEAKKAALQREFATLEINRCYMRDENGEPNSFDFTVETTGMLHPNYVVARACESGIALFQRYSGESLPEDVVVQVAEGRMNGWDFIFQKQDHTLGHCVQAWIDQYYVGKGEVTFAGYDVPHPLRDEMVIRIGVQDSNQATARKILRQAMLGCSSMFKKWLEDIKGIIMPKDGAILPAAKAAASGRVIKRVARPSAQPAKA